MLSSSLLFQILTNFWDKLQMSLFPNHLLTPRTQNWSHSVSPSKFRSITSSLLFLAAVCFILFSASELTQTRGNYPAVSASPVLGLQMWGTVPGFMPTPLPFAVRHTHWLVTGNCFCRTALLEWQSGNPGLFLPHTSSVTQISCA